MREYNLSKTKVRKAIQDPKRKEKGIAPQTVAVMKPFFKKNYKGEIWVMYHDTKKKRKIIAAWRYPGESPVGEEIPIPEDIKNKLTKKHEF